MNDILFRNVMIYDGSGAEPRLGDVSVKDGKIAAVADKISGHHALTIEGNGLALAPGFIDAHSHSDNYVLVDPMRDCRLRQGVTTEIAGQCGSSRGPAAQPVHPEYKRFREATAGKNYKFYYTYDELVEGIEAVRPANNQMAFVGHLVLRGSVVGMENRPATAEELDKMKALLEGAMQQGAPGYTVGLVYSPSQYAPTEELIELAKVVAKYDGIFSTHMRGEAAGLLDSVKETIRIAKEAGVRTNISHLKVMFEQNRPLLKESLRLIEEANAEGCDITFDVYPYTATSAGFLSTLPPSYLAHGIDWVLEELSTPEGVARLEHIILNQTEDWEDSLLHAGFDKDMLVVGEKTPEAIGKTYHEVAVEKGISDTAAFAWLITENGGAGTDVRFLMNEEDVEMLYRHPLCLVGSDGLYKGQGEMSHPRAWGTMTRYLGRYVREKNVQTFAEGIHRITGKTADRYRLKGKGYIREGYDADLVLFDPQTIIDHAEYKDPFRPNEGIEMVFVGGEAAVVRDQLTGVRNGKVLRYGK
ncbi:MAG: D-aminoacylase [Oscillospiraceae bacterium]|nr:D-aminoacylase [Oscillospiraceae bacterium]